MENNEEELQSHNVWDSKSLCECDVDSDLPIYMRDGFFNALYSVAFDIFHNTSNLSPAITYLPPPNLNLKRANLRNEASSAKNTMSRLARSTDSPTGATGESSLESEEATPKPTLSHQVASRLPLLTLSGLTPNCSLTKRPDGVITPSAVGSRPVLVKACAVCGKWTCRKNFGVFTCELCKEFFHRAITRNVTFKPCNYKDCWWRRVKRKSCHSCRYNKCLSVGMKVERLAMPRTFVFQAVLTPIWELIDINLEHESNPQWTCDVSRAIWQTSMLSAKYLYELVEWAAIVPLFERLPFQDRICLLRNGWNGLFISCLTYRSLDSEDQELNLSDTLRIPRELAYECSSGVGKLFDSIHDLVLYMRQLEITDMEMGLLQAMFLCYPEPRSLTQQNMIEKLETNFCEALDQYVILNYSDPDQIGRVGDLLDLRGQWRQLGGNSLHQHRFYELIRHTPFENVMELFL